MTGSVYRNVIVAYDDSEGAKAALERAVEIAARDGASLTLVEALAESHPALVPGGPRSTGPKEAAEGRKQLKEAVDALDSSLQASPWVVGGPAGKAIRTVADDIGADLIVTGSRGRGRVARAVLGSVSSEIVQSAPCDVLVVHP
jgi:nucleotide-binding universal stress UspA family protein